MLLRRRPGVYCAVELIILGGEGWSDLGANALLERYAIGEGGAAIDVVALA